MFKNHPKGLLAASLANMGERFGFYVMMAILSLFLVAKFGLSDTMASIIYSGFYFAIYALALVGGIIADKTRKYKATIAAGIVLMAVGYVVLAIPTETPVKNLPLMLTIACFGLFIIAFGNGLFKGNLQALVGQMYDQNPQFAHKRDEGFSIFYMFINVGSIFAPLMAVLVRNGWLQANNFAYDSNLPELCHRFVEGNLVEEAASSRFVALAEQVSMGENALQLDKIMMPDTLTAAANGVAEATTTASTAIVDSANMVVDGVAAVGAEAGDMIVNGVATVGANMDVLASFANNYLNVFNTGFHYAFGVAIIAMLISLTVFLVNRKIFPEPRAIAKKVKDAVGNVVNGKEEKQAPQIEMSADEIRQRLYALFAVFGVVIFFWFSFHQNGVTLTYFARDYVDLSMIDIDLFGIARIQGAEIFQTLNPLYVVLLTPILLGVFGWLRARGKEPSAPRKIAIGMGVAALAFVVVSLGSMDVPLKSEVDAMGGLEPAQRVTPLLMVVTYLILTIAELFISPLGLSFVSKVAPPHLQGLMQGAWLAATAVGNGILFLGTILYNSIPISLTWVVFAVACLISMLIMALMLKWLERVAT